MNLQSVLSVTATVCTIGLFSTGIPICRDIQKKRSSDGVSALPFLVALFGCLLWLTYGLSIMSGLIIFVNLSGALFNSAYLICFYRYCVTKGSVSALHRQLVILFSSLAAVLCYVFVVETNEARGKFYLGFIGAASNIIFSASPLIDLGRVFKSRSTASLPLAMISVNCIVTLQWLVIGILVDDIFITAPNVVGFVICLFQLSMFLVFPSKSKDQ